MNTTEDVPKGNLYSFTRRLKFELKNDDPSKKCTDCKVQITKIFPDPGYRGPSVLAQEPRFRPETLLTSRLLRGGKPESPKSSIALIRQSRFVSSAIISLCFP